MQTIRVVLDEQLLKAADLAAQRTKQKRSELIREALSEHLRRMETLATEDRGRKGSAKPPDHPGPATVWRDVEDWPEE